MIRDIIAEDKRAVEVIRRLRALLVGGATEMQPVHVNDCIEEVLGLERTDLIAHQVTTDVRLQAGLPAVIGDRVQLQQVLLNLVVNARDAMAEIDPGGRTLRIASAMSDGRIHIEVRDTGRGIPDTEAIFEPFFSTKEHGVGMGLAICRTIISAHGGRLWASNNPGPGATLHVSMPAASLSTASRTASSSSSPSTGLQK
jgi:signal transduction histidine kinase